MALAVQYQNTVESCLPRPLLLKCKAHIGCQVEAPNMYKVLKIQYNHILN